MESQQIQKKAQKQPDGIYIEKQNLSGRDFVMGDLHGNPEALQAFIAEKKLGKFDRVFLVGDLADRGIKSLDTIKYIIEMEEKYKREEDVPQLLSVLGNHELLAIEYLGYVIPNKKAAAEKILGRSLYDKEEAKENLIFNGGEWLVDTDEKSKEKIFDFFIKLPYVRHVQATKSIDSFSIVHADLPQGGIQKLLRQQEDLSYEQKQHMCWCVWGNLIEGSGNYEDTYSYDTSGSGIVICGHDPHTEEAVTSKRPGYVNMDNLTCFRGASYVLQIAEKGLTENPKMFVVIPKIQRKWEVVDKINFASEEEAYKQSQEFEETFVIGNVELFLKSPFLKHKRINESDIRSGHITKSEPDKTTSLMEEACPEILRFRMADLNVLINDAFKFWQEKQSSGDVNSDSEQIKELYNAWKKYYKDPRNETEKQKFLSAFAKYETYVTQDNKWKETFLFKVKQLLDYIFGIKFKEVVRQDFYKQLKEKKNAIKQDKAILTYNVRNNRRKVIEEVRSKAPKRKAPIFHNEDKATKEAHTKDK